MATQAAVDVVMPQMGVSVSEGTITKWLKQPGETVQADEPLLEISTDKVDTEVPSPATGTVREVLSAEGETVAVGTKIAVITPAGAPAEAASVPEPATQAGAESADAPSSAEGDALTADTIAEVEPAAARVEPPPPAVPVAPSGDGKGDKAFVSPVVGRIAAEHGVDPAQVTGTG
ncbi:MAG: E3 binding domain-containing protein, partial [Actinomycetota bacterium]|nr:E3 binding domain-containing protein [Actinomycetota bacterium]